MNRTRFNELVELQIQRIKNSLVKKGLEYQSGNEDVFHNFKNAAIRRGITPERALDGMMLKHEVSIGDIINNIDATNEPPSLELLGEKFQDVINYYILLENLIIERIESKLPY
jgi:hypothetical protein